MIPANPEPRMTVSKEGCMLGVEGVEVRKDVGCDPVLRLSVSSEMVGKRGKWTRFSSWAAKLKLMASLWGVEPAVDATNVV
jgi:hypothetical protein